MSVTLAARHSLRPQPARVSDKEALVQAVRDEAHPAGYVLLTFRGHEEDHDLWHTAELNEALGTAGLLQISLWD